MKTRFLVAAAATLLLTPTALRADQPRMEQAIEHLRLAKASLEQAQQDKGGHRGKAMALIDQAIAEVTSGMRADTRNPEKR